MPHITLTLSLTAALSLASLVSAGTAQAAAVSCQGKPATIVGTSHHEVLHGTPGDDVIAALGGDDIVDGRGGNDLICGGRGADRLNGGRGADLLYGGLDRVRLTDEGTTERAGDVLDGGPGNDRFVPGRDTRLADDVSRDVIDWSTSQRPIDVNLGTGHATGDGHDAFAGHPIAIVTSRLGDIVIGSQKSDQINAGPGSDVVHARGGADVVAADAGHRDRPAADRVWGGKGDDQLSSNHGDDVLRGGSGNDVLDDYANTADRLLGGSGQDLIVSELVVTTKPQVIAGGPGKDRVNLMTNDLNPTARPATGTWNMATGRLKLTLDTPLVATVSGFEDATLSTYGTAWSVTGTEAADILGATGTRGTTFTALGGNDQFMGSSSDDTFLGGAGTDRSLGMGVGDDTCTSVETLDYPDCENITP